MTNNEWLRSFEENGGMLYRVRGDGGSCGVAFLPVPLAWEVRVLTHAGRPLRRRLTFRGVISQEVAERMVEELAAERMTASLNTWVAC